MKSWGLPVSPALSWKDRPACNAKPKTNGGQSCQAALGVSLTAAMKARTKGMGCKRIRRSVFVLGEGCMVIHASRCCAMKHEIKKVCVCVCVCVLMDMCLHFESRSFINRRRRHLGLSYRAILRAKYQLQYRSAILTPEGHLPVSWAISTLNALTHLFGTALLSSKANNSILTSQH